MSASVRRALARGITRNVLVLGLVSLLTDISSELLATLIPLFLANVLAASPSIIGLIEGIAESAAAGLKLASGAISDRIHRRRLLVGLGYAASVASKALYLAATTWPVVLAARLGDRIGKGIRTAPRDALIADSTPPDARGMAFGLHRALDTTGAVIGVGLAALFVNGLQGGATNLGGEVFRTLVLVALVPGVLAVVLIAVAVRDVKAGASPGAPEVKSPARRGHVPATDPPDALGTGEGPKGFPMTFWFFVAATGLFTLGNSSDAFLALRSQQLGVAVRDILLMVVAFNVANALVSWPAGALSDRVGRRALIAFAWGTYALAYGGFALAGATPFVPLLWILYGAYYGVSEAVGRALIADLAPPERRATGYGILNALIGLALLPASIVAGLLWDWQGPSAPFWFGAACAAIATVILLAFVRTGRPDGRR